MTLTVVTVVLLGGVNIFGGSGTIPGVVLAVLAVAVMQNALRLASVTVEVQSIALGLLLILSVVIPNFAHQAKSAIDRVRGGRPPPADSVRRGETALVVDRGGTALKLRSTGRCDRPRKRRRRGVRGVLGGGSPRRRPRRPRPRPRRPPAPARRRQPITVGYLPKDIVNQYFAAAKTGVDKAAAETRRHGHPGRAERGQGGPPDPVHHRPHDPEGQRDHHLGRRQG